LYIICVVFSKIKIKIKIKIKVHDASSILYYLGTKASLHG
jgi:hypothetical protein